MKKFFLFKRRDVNLASTAVSDSGEGLDVLAIPTDSLAFITAEYGKILIVFNDSTIYEENKLLDGESFKKTSVYVSCEPGSEASLIEDILKFISAEKTTSSIMRFDAVLGKTTAAKAVVGDFTDVKAEVKQYPVSRVSQEASTKTFIGGTDGTAFGTDTTIGDIDFGEGNVPIIDFIESNISHSSSNVNGWPNSGSGNSTYDVSSVVGPIPYVATGGATVNGLSTASATFSTSDSLTLANAYTTSKDFTFFCVIGRTKAETEVSKFVGAIAQGATASNYMFLDPLDVSQFKMRLRNAYDLDGELSASTGRPIITPDQTAYVFVVRRDKNSNIFFHDSTGSVVATIPANTERPNTTTGSFSITKIGNSNYKFQGNVARLGVIEKDIGTSAGAKLALDLAKKYTPII